MAAPTIPDARSPEPPAPGGRLHLLVLGPDFTATHALPASGVVLIGRDEGADVRVVDPLASRSHARLQVGGAVELEDVGSANGTFVGERRLRPGERVALAPGDGFTIGSTVLMLCSRAASAPRKIWSHAYFETRLIEECASAESVGATFALVRLHLDGGERPAMEALLPALVRPGDVVARYGPDDYEVLLVDTGGPQAKSLVAGLAAELGRKGVRATAGLAFFPGDATSPQALMTVACAALRGDRGARVATEGGVVLASRAMQELFAVAERAAAGTINVLIVGETGVGKEVLAQLVHARSPRAQAPFVAVNCAAVSEALLESEFFGHERGAFTGATESRPGLLETAAGGTVFLDEVGEMSPALQAKLLRVLETREVMRVGGRTPRSIDVRFVAATNRDLEEEIQARRFREDLYFRLGGITLAIPPLRDRPEEIEPLARRFLEDAARPLGRLAPEIAPEALAVLRRWIWPGNIRELRNVMERALLLCTGGLVRPEHLPLDRMRQREPEAPPPDDTAALRRRLAEDERQAILDALARCAGNQTRAAELLGMPRRTFCTRLREYDIPRPRT